MKLLFDLFPILLFFLAYKYGDVYIATGVAIVATIAQIAWLKLRARKVEPMQWASLGMIVVFGGMTLLFRDETFIKWKPTVLYLLFAAALAFTGRFTGKQPLKAIMGAQLDLPDAVWARLTQAWIGFFLVMAVLNLFVAYRMSLDAWVNFKLFGSLGLTFLFVLAQGLWLGRHMKDPGPAAPPPSDRA
jgi:intracellular septation protein